MQIFFIGPPGCGKSTLAEAVARRLGFPLQSSGEIARLVAEVDEDWGDVLASGNMADRVTMDYLFIRLMAMGPAVFDGYPRYRDQLIDVLTRGKDPIFVWVDADFELCKERMVQRGRTGEDIRARLSTYYRETKPIVDRFRRGDMQAVHAPAILAVDPLVRHILREVRERCG